jgi:hypothetical protein
MGDSIKLIGKGLSTGQVHEPILNAEQLDKLKSKLRNSILMMKNSIFIML